MQRLCITSTDGKTSVTLDGVTLEGVLAFEIIANGTREPILFKPVIRIGGGIEMLAENHSRPKPRGSIEREQRYPGKEANMIAEWMLKKARQEDTNTLRNWIWSAVSQGQPIPGCMSVEALRYVLRERGEDGSGYHNT